MRFWFEVTEDDDGEQILAAYRLGVAAGERRVTADLRRHLDAIGQQLAGIREAVASLEPADTLNVRPPLRVVGDTEGNNGE